MISAITLGEIEYGLQVSKVNTLEQEVFRAFIHTNLPMVLESRKRPESITVRSEQTYSRSMRPMRNVVAAFDLNS